MKYFRWALVLISIVLAVGGWLLFLLNKGILWDFAIYTDYNAHGRYDLFFKHYSDGGIIEQGYINHFIISRFPDPLLVYKVILVLALVIICFCCIRMIQRCKPMDRSTRLLTIFLLLAHPVMLVFISGVTIGYLLSLLFFVLGLYFYFNWKSGWNHVVSTVFFTFSILNFFISAGVYQIFVNYVLYQAYRKNQKLNIGQWILLAVPIVAAGLRYMYFEQQAIYNSEYSDANFLSLVKSYLTILPQSFFPALKNSYILNILFYLIMGWMFWRLVVKRGWIQALFLIVVLVLSIVPFVISSSYIDEKVDWHTRYAVLMPLLGIFLLHFFLEEKYRKTALSLVAFSYSFFFLWFSSVQFGSYLKQKAFVFHLSRQAAPIHQYYEIQDRTRIGFEKTRFYEWTYLANKGHQNKRTIVADSVFLNSENDEVILDYFYEVPVGEFQPVQLNSNFENNLESIIEYFSTANENNYFLKNFSLRHSNSGITALPAGNTGREHSIKHN